jgi:hypothetical protein
VAEQAFILYAGELPDPDRKINEIALHATEHAASCLICQQEVFRILEQDWSPSEGVGASWRMRP